MNTSETIWLYDDPSIAHHDMSKCKCDRHCGNCFVDLANRSVVDPRRRYCSNYCRGRAARERALDRLFLNAVSAPGGER